MPHTGVMVVNETKGVLALRTAAKKTLTRHRWRYLCPDFEGRVLWCSRVGWRGLTQSGRSGQAVWGRNLDPEPRIVGLVGR